MRAVIVALLLAGCSPIFIERPPSNWRPEQGEPRCTEGKGFIAMDIIAFMLGAVSATVVGVSYWNDDTVGGSARAYTVTHGLFATGHLVGAAIATGYSYECTEARKARDAWLAGAR